MLTYFAEKQRIWNLLRNEKERQVGKMNLIAMNCPNCDAGIELDDSREFGFCTFCGTKVMIQDPSKIKVSGSVKIDNSDVAENHMALANQAYTARNYSEAYIYILYQSLGKQA